MAEREHDESSALAHRQKLYKRTSRFDVDARRRAALRRHATKRAEIAEAARRALGEALKAEEDEGAADAADAADSDAMDDGSSAATHAAASTAAAVPPAPHAAGSVRPLRRNRSRVIDGARYYSRQLQLPEWMVRIPPDLNGMDDAAGGGWTVSPRPAGVQSLVIASNGTTQARDKHGRLLGRFYSSLMGGSPARPAHMCGTVLDCVWSPATRVFHVIDMLVWRGRPYFDYPAAVRRFWMTANLPEFAVHEVRMPPGRPPTQLRTHRGRDRVCVRGCERVGEDMDVDDEHAAASTTASALAPPPEDFDINEFAIVPLDSFECDSAGILSAYTHTFTTGDAQDGLLFQNKQAIYEPGSSPLALRWMNAETSAQAREAVAAPRLHCDLKVANDRRALLTMEEVDVAASVSGGAVMEGVEDGDLVRVEYARALRTSEGAVSLTDARVIGVAPHGRVHPDTASKLLFYDILRTSGWHVHDILAVAQRLVHVDDTEVDHMDD